MKFKNYVNKLENSKNFKDFKEKNKDAYLCSAFFIIDKKTNLNKQNLDYYVPSSKSAFGFKVEQQYQKEKLQDFLKVPEKIPGNFDFEINEIEKMIHKKIEDSKIKNKIEKIIFSLQRLNSKDILVVNVFLSGLVLVNLKISMDDKKIFDFEKKSFFSMFKLFQKKNKKT